MKLKDAQFAVLDVETTGLYPFHGDKICEIGALRAFISTSKPSEFHSLINPERSISNAAYMVNKISEDMLKGMPTIDQVMPAFLKFIENTVIVAYNAGFDLGFIESAMPPSRAFGNFFVIDALKLARKLFSGYNRYNLSSVAGCLGLSHRSAHRAMSDVHMTWGVFRKEVDILLSMGVDTVEEVVRMQSGMNSRAETVKDYSENLVDEAIGEQVKMSALEKRTK